jgi:hypothetical protein
MPGIKEIVEEAQNVNTKTADQGVVPLEGNSSQEGIFARPASGILK